MKSKQIILSAVSFFLAAGLALARNVTVPPYFDYPEEELAPYVSTYHVEPTVTTAEEVVLRFFVTDWDNSLVRFGDDSHRFDVTIRYRKEGDPETTVVLRDLPSGDNETSLGRLPVGDYTLAIKCTDRKGRDSHTVWHEFRIREPGWVAIPPEKIRQMTEEDLSRYGIRNDGDHGELFPVILTDYNADAIKRQLDEAIAANAATVPADGYRIYVGANDDGQPAYVAWTRCKVVYGANYDKEAVEATALRTVQGLQRLLDESVEQGYRKVVLLPGTYRVSHQQSLLVPSRMTLDLNGATLKQNEFTGSSATIVKILHAHDAHLVNGILEGDYYEHDYANSPNQSEWVNGFSIEGDSRYSTVEDLVVRDITGYGGGCGMSGSFPGQAMASLPTAEPGAIRMTDGTIDPTAEKRVTFGFRDISSFTNKYITLSKHLGYQGRLTPSWLYTAAFYDADKRFLSAERAYQYRSVLIPEGARYFRATIIAESVTEANKLRDTETGLCCHNMRIPWNCAIKNCTIIRSRAVGLVTSAMRNMLIEGNDISKSGETLARCAFDAEDGWDRMQDVTIRKNRFHDNPANELVVCAGHNFVIEENELRGTGAYNGILLWGRSTSPCVRSNVTCNATFECSNRNGTMHGRYEGNTILNSLNLGNADYATDWDIVIHGESYGDPASTEIGKPAIRSCPKGRFRDCDFANLTYRGSNFEDCRFDRGSVPSFINENFHFADCSFQGVSFNHCSMTGRWENCTLTDCTINSGEESRITITNCTIASTTYEVGYWTKPMGLEVVDSSIDLADKGYFLRIPLYSLGDVVFERNKILGANDAASIVEIYDARAQDTDDRLGHLLFTGNEISAPVPCLAKITDTGSQPVKNLLLACEGGTLPTGTKVSNVDVLAGKTRDAWDTLLRTIVTVRTSPAGLLQEDFQPPFAETNFLEEGATYDFSAPKNLFVRHGLHYRCLGYVREELVDGFWRNATTNLGPTAFSYVHGPRTSRVTWLYERDGYLDVAGSPAPLGEVTPPYGLLEELETGQVVPCQAPDKVFAVSEGVRALCTGWTLLRFDDALGDYAEVSAGKTASLTYRQDLFTAASRLRWHFDVSNRVTAAVNETALGSVDHPETWLLDGSSITLTATPAAGSVFYRWSGDTQGEAPFSPTLVLKADRPLDVKAHFYRTDEPLPIGGAERKRLPLVVSGYRGEAPLADFPLLVRLREGEKGFSHAYSQPHGEDLRFVLEDGTELAREIDTWNEDGETLVWVRIPSLANGLRFFCEFAGQVHTAHPTSQTDGSVWKPAGYIAVWHMAEKDARDATGLGNDGKGSNNQTFPGRLGKGQLFRGNGRIDCGTVLDPAFAQGFSVESWICPSNVAGARAFFGKDNCATLKSNGRGFNLTTPGIQDHYFKDDKLLTLGAWSHVVVTFAPEQPDGCTLYFDGEKKESMAASRLDAGKAGGLLLLGNNQWNQAAEGVLDEIRLSKVVHSADWARACHDTVASPGFLTAEEAFALPDRLRVTALPAELGTVVPAYGIVEGLTAGAELDCAAPAEPFAIDEGVLAVCTGWTLYGFDHAVDAFVYDRDREDASGTAKSFRYRHPAPGVQSRLEWIFAISNLVTATVSDAALGSVDRPASWVVKDGAITLTATAKRGATFLKWTGDVQGNDPTSPTIVLAADKPLAVEAVFFPGGWQPGLRAGHLEGPFNVTDYPEAPSIVLDPQAATNSTTPWGPNRTWVYWGQIYVEGDSCYFLENIDDQTRLVIDGQVVIENGGGHWDYKATSRLDLRAGWHDFEVRFWNGGGSAGPSGSSTECLEGFKSGFGLFYGEEAPATMALCNYPADPGNATVFRHADIDGFGTPLHIRGADATGARLDLGEVTPPYGITNHLVRGDSFRCSAPATVLTNRILWAVQGYTLCELGYDDKPVRTNATGTTGSFTYLHPGVKQRLEWRWEIACYQVEASAGTNGAVSTTGGIRAPGTEITITAIPDRGALFRRWSGDIQGNDPFSKTITLVVDGPLSVEASFSVPGSHQIPLEIGGYAGTTPLTNVPVLVRLSEGTEGFSYADCAADGADISFFLEDGTELPREIDSWNTNGVSFVWVRVPVLEKGLRLRCEYGDPATAQPPCQSDGSVWAGGYEGVWHFTEPDGIAADSSANDLDAVPQGKVEESVAVDGVVGPARQNGQRAHDATRLLVPDYDHLALGGRFTVSGWFNAREPNNWMRLLSRKNGYSTTNGWELEVGSGNYQDYYLYGSSGRGRSRKLSSSLRNDWKHLAIVFDRSVVALYENGVLLSSDTIDEVVDNSLPLAFGGTPNGKDSNFPGLFDEIRLFGAPASAERIRAEYEMMATENYVASAPAVETKGSLAVVCTPAIDLTGRMDPAAGAHDGYAAGAERLCSVPAGVIPLEEGVCAVCTGWKLYGFDPAAHAYVFDPDRENATGEANSFTYRHPTPANGSKLEWLFSVSNRVTAATTDASLGTVDKPLTWVEADGTIVLTATAKAHSSFRRWSGDIQGNDPRSPVLTLKADRPLDVAAHFGRNLYVAVDGDDANAGTTPETAFATVAKALGTAVDGEVIFIGAGTFPADATLQITNAVEVRGEGIDVTILTTPQPEKARGYRTIRMNHAGALLRDLTVTGGRLDVYSDPGLGILIDKAGGTVTRCRITRNLSNTYHTCGAVALLSPDAVLTYCVIDSNRLTIGSASGGGVYVKGGLVENCLIVGNAATSGGGLALMGPAVVRNCTITGNRAGSTGGGLYWYNCGKPEISRFENNIIAWNEAPNDSYEGAPEWAYQYPDHPDWGHRQYFEQITANCLFGATRALGTNSISGDPVFADAPGGDFTLLAGSPAIDAGVGYDGIAATDLAGLDRVMGRAIDLGCYEYDSSALSCGFSVDRTILFEGESVAFQSTVFGASDLSAVVFDWTLTSREGKTVTGSGEAPVITIPEAGWYDVTLKATDTAAGLYATLTRPALIHVATRTSYFDAPGKSTPVYPWKTPETAGTNLQEIVSEAIDGATVILAAGEFPLTNQVEILSGVTLTGAGIDETVFVPESKKVRTRLFYLNHPDCVLEGVTVKGAGHTGSYSDYGNGVCIANKGGTLRHSRVTACWANGSYHHQGAVGVSSARGIVSGCLIEYNTNTIGGVVGGGLAMGAGFAENCLIRHNFCEQQGGGVSLGGNATIRNCLVYGNIAKTMGGAISITYNGPTVQNCTFADNASIGTSTNCSSGGIYLARYVDAKGTKIVNSIFAGNRADNVSGQAFGWPEWDVYESPSTNVFRNCLFSGSEPTGTDAVTGDPRFRDPATGDYTTKAGSPARNRGLYEEWMEGATDLAGRPRIDQKQLVDIGCHEAPYAPPSTLLLLR